MKIIKPKTLKKGRTIYIRTKYGSYINSEEYGMAAQKNAMSLKELLNLGFREIKLKQ